MNAYDRVVKFLSYRLRSENEIRQKLEQKGFAKPEIKQTIVKLKEEKLIDDAQFARAWIVNREIVSPRGRKLIFLELRQKGVDKELIEKTLRAEYDNERELSLASKIAEKKNKFYQKLPEKERRQKIIRFLQRRGFSWEIIRKVI